MKVWVSKKPLINSLVTYFKKNSGRNNTGKITVRHKGGGFFFSYKILDNFRSIWYLPAIVRSIESSQFHSAHLASVFYPNGISSYILAPEGLRPGNVIYSGINSSIKIGNNLPLSHIPLNIKIHNIESFPGSGAKYIRAAGNWAKIIERTSTYVVVGFKNNIKKKISNKCCATIGSVSNFLHRKQTVKFKAGDSRNMGIRPSVRGVVQNPVDHPHGGGKGKKSPWNPNYNYVRLLPKGRKTSKKIYQ